MKALAYYNEHDAKTAAWLRHLIEEGVIAPGVVDERSITQVDPDELRGYVQCHFFAGIGVWSYALRRAGWADDRPVWTGSCPCQPFSAAGKKLGFADPRHLWPAWFRLIRERRPDVLFGEQSDDADAWIDLVATDLEGDGYAFGAPDIPAAGFGGDHIRQRFYWVADAYHAEWWSERAPWNDGHWPAAGRFEGDGHARDGGAGRGLGDASGGAGEWLPGGLFGPQAAVSRAGQRDGRGAHGSADAGDHVGLGDAGRGGSQGWTWDGRAGAWTFRREPAEAGGPEWIWCRDQKWRPVEPGSSPLAVEAAARLGRLRGYGNALDAEAAANFIGAYLDCAPARGLAA